MNKFESGKQFTNSKIPILPVDPRMLQRCYAPFCLAKNPLAINNRLHNINCNLHNVHYLSLKAKTKKYRPNTTDTILVHYEDFKTILFTDCP